MTTTRQDRPADVRTQVMDNSDRDWPPVSVVMPVLNEERSLREAVARVLGQDYPGELELVIAVGPSSDRTAQIADTLASGDRRVRLVSNPSGATPAGLNLAIGQARHGVVVRVDGHGLLSDGYIRAAVRLLRETGADNVGGLMAAEGETPFEQAVARSMTSPLGIGGARFHVGGGAGPADTVYLGVFRRDTLDRLGGYDEAYRRAQDWELNFRIRESGGVVWFSPELRVTYRPRSSLRALGRQFFQTGQWRHVVVRLHRGTTSARYLAAPAAVAACTVGLAAGVAGLAGVAGVPGLADHVPALLAGLLLPGGYVGGVLAGSAVIGRGLPWRARAWLPVVVATMHMTWGAGFWASPRSLGSVDRIPGGDQDPG